MEITNVCPIILTPKAADVIEVFEALGFERHHQKKDIKGESITAVAMKNEGGFRVVVTQVDQLPQDMVSVQINVRDFDEMQDLLASKGFKRMQDGEPTDTGSSVGSMMIAPSGFAISFSEHIRK